MDKKRASESFATLGHPDRLAVFGLLMRFAPRGQRPTEIAQALGLKQNTLSHHLADLSAAGLVQVARQGRSLYYSVDLDVTEALIGHLAIDVGRARPDLLGPLLAARPSHTPDTAQNVLFICTGNSARSIIAEVLLRDLGAGRFIAHSAGTSPRETPHPRALGVLAQHGHDTSGLFGKPLSGFQRPDAPVMQFVFTVCDIAASEECPPWPGLPLTAHWGLPPPARTEGSDADRAQAFSQTYAALRRRIETLVALPVGALDRLALQHRIDALDADALTIEKG